MRRTRLGLGVDEGRSDSKTAGQAEPSPLDQPYRTAMSVRSASIGLEALGANPLRTVLSTSGVVIGVAALVAVLALGDGVERFTREQFSNTTSLQAILVAPK